jgi:hypothetical protein
LQKEIYNTKHTAKSRMNLDIEQIRASHQQQIKQLQDNLEMLYQSSHTSKGLITHNENLIEQLQARLALTENTMIDILSFKTQEA